MRSSRQASVLSNADKIHYPKCNRKKQHGKELLNFICLSTNCSRKGLICVQCKTSSEHVGHNVQPLKSFLTKMEEVLKKHQLQKGELPIEQNEPSKPKNETNLLEKLEENHLEMLSTLKIQVEEISERVMRCEEELMQEYSKTRQRLMSEFEKETFISKALAEIQQCLTEEKEKEQNDLKMSVFKLLSLIKVEKQQIIIQNEAEHQYNAYQLASNSFKMNLLAWERQTTHIIGDIFRLKPEYEIKEQKNRPTTAMPSKSNSNPMSFSTQFKTDSVLLSNQNRLAKVKDDKHGKVVLFNQKVLNHIGPIKLKIPTLSSGSQVQVGLCLKTHVSQKQYKFEKNNINHGYFVFSSNGFIYSCKDQSANNTKSNFIFKVNDELTMQVVEKDKKLLLSKTKNQNKPHELSLKHLSANDWQDLYFCVSLQQIGDKVQILS